MSEDTILSLARAEAGRIRKFRDSEDERVSACDDGSPQVPLMHITPTGRAGGARWSVTSSGEGGHPNEARMSFLCRWVGMVLSGDGIREGDPSGTFRVELHDSYSYLPRSSEYHDVLSFGRKVCGTPGSTVALFPDPYMASGFGAGGSMLGPRDQLQWGAKRATVVFAGSTTGEMDARMNARIMACVWASAHRQFLDFRISAIVQMGPHAACQRVPQLADVIGPHLPPSAQFRHRYIANIVGNTACWSRLPMVLRSNSLLFHVPHGDIAWYYPELRAGVHFVECPSHQDFLSQRLSCEGDPARCSRIVAAANTFFDKFLTPEAAATYAVALLYDIRGK